MRNKSQERNRICETTRTVKKTNFLYALNNLQEQLAPLSDVPERIRQ